jgi:hypothetical protein
VDRRADSRWLGATTLPLGPLLSPRHACLAHAVAALRTTALAAIFSQRMPGSSPHRTPTRLQARGSAGRRDPSFGEQITKKRTKQKIMTTTTHLVHLRLRAAARRERSAPRRGSPGEASTAPRLAWATYAPRLAGRSRFRSSSSGRQLSRWQLAGEAAPAGRISHGLQ